MIEEAAAINVLASISFVLAFVRRDWSVAGDCSADEVKLEDGVMEHVHAFLEARHVCCRICCVKVLSEFSFEIFVRAKNKDWLKAVHDSYATSTFWGLSLGRRWRSDNLCEALDGRILPLHFKRLVWKQYGFVECIHWSPSAVFSHLYCLVCSIAFFMFLHGGPGPDTASQTLSESFRCLHRAHFTPEVPTKMGLVNKINLWFIYCSNM